MTERGQKLMPFSSFFLLCFGNSFAERHLFGFRRSSILMIAVNLQLQNPITWKRWIRRIDLSQPHDLLGSS